MNILNEKIVMRSANEKDSVPRKRVCPVCSGGDSTIIRNVEMLVPDELMLQHKYEIVTCNSCGMVFHDVDPEQDRLDYYEEYTGQTVKEYSISNEQKSLDKRAVDFLIHACLKDKDLEILDVGSSYGAMLLQLQDMGFTQLNAIDPDKAAISFLGSKGISAIQGVATNEIEGFHSKFDVLMLRHVLEHLYNPIETIRNISNWMKPNGYLYIELPDLSRYQETSPFPGYYFEYEHINHFSLISLRNLLRNFELTHYESTSEIYPCHRALFKKTLSLER